MMRLETGDWSRWKRLVCTEGQPFRCGRAGGKWRRTDTSERPKVWYCTVSTTTVTR